MDRLMRQPEYEGPAAWTATEMRQRRDWIVALDADEVVELYAPDGSRP